LLKGKTLITSNNSTLSDYVFFYPDEFLMCRSKLGQVMPSLKAGVIGSEKNHQSK